jgi:hypothetical protein
MINSCCKIEQDYLNSCVSTTFINELLSYNPSITSLFIISNDLFKKIEKKIEQVKNETKQNFIRKIVEKAKFSMDSTKSKLEDILKSNDPVNPKEIREIILDWSLAMQEYFFAMNSNSVGAPAKK